MEEETVSDLFAAVEAQEGYQLDIDLAAQCIHRPDGADIAFDVDPFRKDCLLRGLDDIGVTLQDAERIRAYEQRRRQEASWLFHSLEEQP